MPLTTQLGVKAETTWGTAVTVDRFFEFESETIKPDAKRVESAVLRSGTKGMREDRFVPYVSSYAGSVTMPVLTKGFGFFLQHMIGGSVTTGSLTDSTYTHTATLNSSATLCGKGFTAQFNRPLGDCQQTDQAFTYEGGKVSSWKVSCDQGGAVMAELSLVFEAGTTATALATASYPTGMELFPFGASSLTIAGSAVDVKSWSVECDNGLKVDREMIRSSYSIKEPVESSMREVTFSATLDYDALATVYNRVISSTSSGAMAAVVITSLGPTLAGTTTYPGLVITMDKVRFDDGVPNVSGPDMAEIQLTGKALIPASGTWLSVAYRSTETTP